MASDPLDSESDSEYTYQAFGSSELGRPEHDRGGHLPKTEQKPDTPGGSAARGSGTAFFNYNDDPEAIPADSNGYLFGKYRVIHKLGGGGMAFVWLVEHVRLEQKRALKIIKSEVAEKPANRLRFKQEAKILAKLSRHPNAVPVHDTDMVGRFAYIEMEYLEGKTLRDCFTQDEPLPLTEVVWILRELCDVLGEAHDLGIVHRDIKPQNIMIVDDPSSRERRVKVLDFGIAKILKDAAPDTGLMTMHTEAYMGTVPYSSPEQLGVTLDGQKEPTVDHRSDIYSLGVLLYEMLVGKRPFSGDQTKLMYAHAYTPPPSFAEHAPNADVPGPVEEVVLRCLEKNPANRPQSARELFDSFQAAVKRAEVEDTAIHENFDSIPADANGFLFDKYRVIRSLGGGGMASVWLVEHVRLERQSALKVIRSDIAQNPTNRLRFEQEAVILAKLSRHPNAVAVQDTDIVGRFAYIEMDYLEGQTLRKSGLLQAGGVPRKPPPEETWIQQSCATSWSACTTWGLCTETSSRRTS